VIEYVSGTCQTAPGEGIVQVFLVIPTGGFAHWFVPVNITFNSTLKNDYTFAQQTRLYATPDRLCTSELAESVLSWQTIPAPCNSVAIWVQ
jgi:hypothetical protein